MGFYVFDKAATINGDDSVKYAATLNFETLDSLDKRDLADYIFVLNEGNLVGEYTPEQFLKSNEEVINYLKADLPHEEENK